MENICTGCLATGRKLYFIGETGFYQLYSQILNEIPVQDISQVCVRVCWECRASLRKFQLFKTQVKHCYTELLWNIPSPSLPVRLSTYEAFNISYPDPPSNVDLHQDSEAVKEENSSASLDRLDVKVKIEADDGTEEHREPETFVKDLMVEENYSKPSKKSKKKTKAKKQRKSKIKVKKKKKDEEVGPSEPVQSEGSEPELCIDEFHDDLQDNGEENRKEDKEISIEVKLPVEETENIVPSEVVKANAKASSVRVPKPPPPALLPEKPQCVECGKIFSSRKTYRYHLNVLHKGQNRYPCPRCGKVYQWKSNLGRHMRTHKAVDAGELYCETCDKSFASVATYRQHLRISRRHVTENEFSFTCSDCGKKFVNKTRLRDHIDWEHLKKIKYRCQLCNKSYKCHTSLYVHLQNVHRNKEKKDHLCHVCGKSYQNPAKLKYHIIAIHTGETPYQCAQCSAAFGWYSSLYRHVREVHYKMKVQPKKTKKTKKLENEPPGFINFHP